VNRHGRPEIHRVREQLAIDGERDGLAQLVALQPRGARVFRERARLEVEPEAVGVEADAQVVQDEASGVGRLSGAYASGVTAVSIVSICPASRRSSSAFWSPRTSMVSRSRYGSAPPSGALRK
jgi:hypothetical protein